MCLTHEWYGMQRMYIDPRGGGALNYLLIATMRAASTANFPVDLQ